MGFGCFRPRLGFRIPRLGFRIPRSALEMVRNLLLGCCPFLHSSFCLVHFPSHASGPQTFCILHSALCLSPPGQGTRPAGLPDATKVALAGKHGG